jgi:membrane-associated phospholipid phosphatase
MSATGGLKTAAAERAMSRPQWVRANLLAGLALLVRAPRMKAPSGFAWRTPPLRLAVGAIVAVVAILVTMVIVDAWAIAAARRVPVWLDGVFSELTGFGRSNWVLVPSGLLLVAIAILASPALPRISRLVLTAVSVRLAFLFLAVGFPGLVVTIVKRFIGRARPLIEGSLDPFRWRLFDWSVEYASLPSGHSTNAFAAAFALGALWPKGRVLFWSYALIIAVSRVVIVAHHPSDVLAGAVAGVLGALIVRDWFAVRRLGFVPDGKGGVRTLPAPSFGRIKRVARQLAAQ